MVSYGKGGAIFTNRREEVEMAALCLRVLQTSRVFVSTLTLQDVLAEPPGSGPLGPAERLDLTSRLTLGTPAG